jgi:hypothetical protein
MAIRKELLQFNEEFEILLGNSAGKMWSERDANSGSKCMSGPRR